MIYRTPDLRPELEDTRERLREAESKITQLRLKKRASEARWAAIKRLAPWLAGGVVTVLGTILLVNLDWNKPRHEHVIFEGQQALRTSCDSSNNVAADCRAEAANECSSHYKILDETSVYRDASVTTIPISCGNNCITMTTVSTPARYEHTLTYRCEVRE